MSELLSPDGAGPKARKNSRANTQDSSPSKHVEALIVEDTARLCSSATPVVWLEAMKHIAHGGCHVVDRLTLAFNTAPLDLQAILLLSPA